MKSPRGPHAARGPRVGQHWSTCKINKPNRSQQEAQLLIGKTNCMPVSDDQQMQMTGQISTLFEGKGESAMEALDGAFANICSLSIVTIVLIQFSHNTPCKFWSWDHCLGEQMSVGGQRWYRR